MSTYSTHAFAEKVALISDGSNPVGRAVALQLALYGAYVIVGWPAGSSENRSALLELQSLGTLASSVEADVSRAAGGKILVGEVEKKFGRLDLLVNTLKYRSDSDFLETDEESWNRTVNTNLRSVFFVCREAIKLMKMRPKPRIVNIAYAEKKDIAFETVQAGLIGLTRSLAGEFAPQFRINCVEVGEADQRTETDENLDPELFRPKSGIAPDDVARAVLFLLSSEAVGLNGQVLTVG